MFFRSWFIKGNWIFHSRVNREEIYKTINKQQMVVESHSTIGFQALAKGIKCAFFYTCFPEKGSHLKFSKKGPFWTNSNTYDDFTKIMEKK